MTTEYIPAVMESYINATNQSINGGSDNINFDIPSFATYLNMFFLLVAMPAIIVPAVSVIRVILTTEKLRTVYYLFVINLLATDVLNTLKMAFEVILMCLHFLGINADSMATFIIYTMLVIPRIAARLSFINLAIDRAVAIAFPYRHKSIMTYKRAYVMLILTWIISSIMTFIIYLPAPFAFVGSFGIYTPVEKPIGRVILFVFLLVLSTILIVCVNVYLYVQIYKSKQKLEENMRTHGTADGNIEQLRRTNHKFRKQVKITLSLLALGGVDGIINLLTMITLIVSDRFLSGSTSVYSFQFAAYPLLCVQLMSHSLLYGIYMKDIRKKLCKCYLYQRLKRALPLRPSKVVVLN